MEEVMQAAGSDMAVLVKMNMRDGFKGGMEIDETGWYTFKNPGTKLLQEDGKINESLFSDGLHPNEEGYKRIVDEIAH